MDTPREQRDPAEENLPVHLLRLTKRRTLWTLAVESVKAGGPLEVHAPITWRVIDPDGDEEIQTGRLWHQAPPVKGMTAFWAMPDPEPAALLCVIRASRRHRVGRMVELGSVTYWTSKGGRYVDRGTFYTETHPKSPSGARTAAARAGARAIQPPRAIRQPNIPAEHRWFFQHYGGGPAQECYPGRVSEPSTGRG